MEEKADEAVEEEETDRLATDCRAYTCTVSRLVDLFFIFLSLHFSFFFCLVVFGPPFGRLTAIHSIVMNVSLFVKLVPTVMIGRLAFVM